MTPKKLYSLNATMTEQINIKKENNWKDCKSSIDYKINNKKLWRTVKKTYTPLRTVPLQCIKHC